MRIRNTCWYVECALYRRLYTYMKQKFKKITLANRYPKILTFCFCVIQRYEQGRVQAALWGRCAAGGRHIQPPHVPPTSQGHQATGVCRLLRITGRASHPHPDHDSFFLSGSWVRLLIHIRIMALFFIRIMGKTSHPHPDHGSFFYPDHG